MTTDAPSPERVEVEQVDIDAADKWLRRSFRNTTTLAQSFARYRIATAQASDAEIERLNGKANAWQEACAAMTVEKLAAEAESARLREALERIAKRKFINCRSYLGVAQDMRSEARKALAAGTSQEVGRG